MLSLVIQKQYLQITLTEETCLEVSFETSLERPIKNARERHNTLNSDCSHHKMPVVIIGWISCLMR